MTLPTRPFRFQPCAACCHLCQACANGVYPDELTLAIELVNRAFGSCWDDCENANGSWVLEKSGDCQETQWPITEVWQSAQGYLGSFPDVTICLGGTLVIDLTVYWNYSGVTGQRAIFVTVGNTHGWQGVQFLLVEAGQTEPYDCTSFADLAIPLSAGGLSCEPGATCQLSS